MIFKSFDIMRRIVMHMKLVLMAITLVFFTSCAHVEPVPNRTMKFDEGMKVLASNLAEQLENSSIGNVLNKVVIDPLTNQKQLNKIVIDPFIDVESGYPVKTNARIVEIISRELMKRFKITGEMEPDSLEVSEYVLNGMVSIEEKHKNIYKVYATVFQKSSGKVLASATVHVNRFDTTPKEIYKDSPIFLKGQDYEHYVSSVKKMPDETVNQEYHDSLTIKSMQVKGDKLYEQKEFKKSLSYYNQAANSKSGQQLEILNGQFTILVKQGQWKAAEDVYKKLLKASIAETNAIASKIFFNPRSIVPMENKADVYAIYMKQIASLVASNPKCKVKIIGHCSRTGTEAYNEKLSRDRAVWIQKQMAAYMPDVLNRSEPIGRGFHDNIVGTGKDDVTDQIDRRVEFVFDQCGE
jgi:outer membrane protein OmpA-like peptidoglycan-associated protein